jgi:hypothetical protein
MRSLPLPTPTVLSKRIDVVPVPVNGKKVVAQGVADVHAFVVLSERKAPFTVRFSRVLPVTLSLITLPAEFLEMMAGGSPVARRPKEVIMLSGGGVFAATETSNVRKSSN